MGDELVSEVAMSLDGLAFANGLGDRFRPIVDAIVNSLRDYGMTDDQIRAALVPK